MSIIKLISTQERSGSAYVEFFVGDSNAKIENWMPKSKLLSIYIFDPIFSNCFRGKDNLFDVAGPPIFYDKEDLTNILSVLKEKRIVLENIDSIESLRESTGDFLQFFSKELERDYRSNWKDSWRGIKTDIIQINDSLIILIEDTIKNDKGLWVIGV